MASSHSVVFVRHGESEFNRDNIFTGWCDPDLTTKGVAEAKDAGKILREYGFEFDIAFTSLLKRAIKTLYFIQDELDCHWIPVTKTWMLNERHYGKLQGKNKDEVAGKYGPEQVQLWRRAFYERPPLLEETDEHWNGSDKRYADLPFIPAGESLDDTSKRSLPFWHNLVVPALRAGQKPLVCGHANILRNLIKHLDSNLSLDIKELNLPNALPLVVELDENLVPSKFQFLNHGNGMAPKKRSSHS
ncbi:2,3-bisphosphoglycerate-dependent phosphoglycerate mutase [Plakobranchus ocellatus]|uniref:phosphoglycerate mutase (2,3-diphosphoglycerate-dependent) n=1 Tax=Plakobranchus ocellatus TaxID=259542 RepID=A0AAV3Y4W7_9GAST|nr:2,3-bisphosphoglycerate-dependent phosphoglycerate mutase [Plakobranchus ocellatus]